LYVLALGDSPMDLAMLAAADQAVVVVGPEETRSKTMDAYLSEAIEGGLRASQVLLPPHATPRLDTTRLPVIKLLDELLFELIMGSGYSPAGIRVLHDTNENFSKPLMTPTRDASVSGTALREAHRRIGFHLSITYLSTILGISEYPITHVQGHITAGWRVRHEEKTTIVAIMRGGEPMAFGVNDALPIAMFVHASGPEDIKRRHVEGQRTIILVDSVINSGETMMEFVRRAREIHARIEIVVVAGVIQVEAVERGGGLTGSVKNCPNFSVVALRVSENRFTGSGGTDTGNRLFNTTHLA
jgi:uracil phosphoribosyltransferase